MGIYRTSSRWKISKKQTLEPLLCLLVRQNRASVPKHQPSCRIGTFVSFFTKVASVPEQKPRQGPSAETSLSCIFCLFPWHFDAHCAESVETSLFHLASVHLSLSSQIGLGTETNASARCIGTPLSSHRHCLRLRQDTIEAAPRRFALSFAFP